MNLWDHQRRAVEESRDRPATMLDMGMGTGKTAVVLQLAHEWACRRILVLCTKSGIDVWPALLAKHLPEQAERWRVAAERGKTVAHRTKTIKRELEFAKAVGVPAMVVLPP